MESFLTVFVGMLSLVTTMETKGKLTRLEKFLLSLCFLTGSYGVSQVFFTGDGFLTVALFGATALFGLLYPVLLRVEAVDDKYAVEITGYRADRAREQAEWQAVQQDPHYGHTKQAMNADFWLCCTCGKLVPGAFN